MASAPPPPQDRATARGRTALALAVTLSGLAGWVDAVGFVHWHGLFVSFMSGNTTETAASVGNDWGSFAETGGAIVVFVAGVCLGELVGAASGRFRCAAVLGSEALLLWAGLAASLWTSGEPATASALGLAMGLQNAALHEADGVAVSLTFVTGTLVKIGRGLAEALQGAEPLSAILPSLGMWLGLFAGAVLGAAASRVSEAVAIAVVAALATGLAILSGAAAGRRDPPGG